MRPGGGEGLRASSPEMEAYYNALAQQDAQLAAGAQQAGQQQVQFGGALGEFVGGALPGLFGAGTTINPLRTDEFGRVEPLTPEEQQAQDEMMQNYNNQLAAYRAKGGQGLYIPGVTG